MGTNCVPLLADLFLYYYEADFIQELLRKKGEITATNVTITEETRNRLFYKIKINLVSHINQIISINSVAIHCTVGGNDIAVMENTSLYCLDTNTSCFANIESTEKTKRIPITLAFILPLSIIVISSVIIWRNGKNVCERKMNIEGGNLQSTSSEMSCAMAYLRCFTIIIEDSERILLLPKHALLDTRRKVNVIPAQTVKHVKKVLRYLILHDKSYTQKISSDTRINIARKSTQTEESFNIFSYQMTTSTCNRNRCPINEKTRLVAESNRMIYRIILEFNAFVEALNPRKRLNDDLYDKNNLKDGNNSKAGNTKPSLSSSIYRSSNDVKRSTSSSTHPAQKTKDVARIVLHACLHDAHYIQVLVTNIGINLARSRSTISGLHYSTFYSRPATKTSETWMVSPAQKVIDVTRVIHYYVLHDKSYIQKRITNIRINNARKQ